MKLVHYTTDISIRFCFGKNRLDCNRYEIKFMSLMLPFSFSTVFEEPNVNGSNNVQCPEQFKLNAISYSKPSE